MRLTLGGVAVCMFAMTGCSGGRDTETAAKPSAEGAAFLAKAEPAGGQGVGEVKEAAKDGDEVTLVGRIGGSAEPFVDGLASFTIVDPMVPFCAADEGCPTPWDYCCETDKIPANSATVKLVGADGKPVATGARELLGVKELNVVVVHGKAQRDDAGNLTVLADEVFVRPEGATPPAAEGGHGHGHEHDESEHEHASDEA